MTVEAIAHVHLVGRLAEQPAKRKRARERERESGIRRERPSKRGRGTFVPLMLCRQARTHARAGDQRLRTAISSC